MNRRVGTTIASSLMPVKLGNTPCGIVLGSSLGDSGGGMAALAHCEVSIPSGAVMLPGTLDVPAHGQGLVIFAHGSGSSRHSARNVNVASALREAGIATLLLDLLTHDEDVDPQVRFDIPLLTERLGDALRFVNRTAATCSLRIGLFGASTGAASALRLAAEMPDKVRAVVSRGGRPDLVGDQMLPLVRAPTLLIVGGADRDIIASNRAAARYLQCEHSLVLVPGAGHLFEEPGTLDRVAVLAREWFARHLVRIPVRA